MILGIIAISLAVLDLIIAIGMIQLIIDLEKKDAQIERWIRYLIMSIEKGEDPPPYDDFDSWFYARGKRKGRVQ